MIALAYEEATAIALELLQEPHGSEEKDARLALRMGWRRVEEPLSKQGGTVQVWRQPGRDEPFGLSGTRNVAHVLGWLIGKGWHVNLGREYVSIPGVARVDYRAEVPEGFHRAALPLAICTLFVLAPPSRNVHVQSTLPHGRSLAVGPAVA